MDTSNPALWCFLHAGIAIAFLLLLLLLFRLNNHMFKKVSDLAMQSATLPD